MFSFYGVRTQTMMTNQKMVPDTLSYESEDFGKVLFTSAISKNARISAWIEHYAPSLRAVCDKYCASFSSSVYGMDDLFQEACLVVTKTWDTYNPDKVQILSVTYFSRCVENHFISMWRKQHAQKAFGYSVSLSDFSDAKLSANEDDIYSDDSHLEFLREFLVEDRVDEKIAEQEFMEKVWGEIKKLPDALRAVAKLRIKGYTQMQIAERLSISQPCVCMRIKKVAAVLAEIM